MTQIELIAYIVLYFTCCTALAMLFWVVLYYFFIHPTNTEIEKHFRK